VINPWRAAGVLGAAEAHAAAVITRGEPDANGLVELAAGRTTGRVVIAP